MAKQVEQAQDEKDYQEYLEYQQYLASQGGLSDKGPLEPALEEAADPLTKGVRVLDYQRANATGPLIAKALSKLTGKPVAKNVDQGKVRRLEADFPGTGEMMKQAGILTGQRPAPPGTDELPLRETGFNPMAPIRSMFTGEMPDFARSIIGMGGDILSDPATYESMGVSALSRLKNLGKLEAPARALNMAFNPLEEFNRWRAGRNYGKAFEKLDEIAVDKDKTMMPSKMLQERGFSGNAREAAQEIKRINKEAGREIGTVLTESASKGAAVDPNNFAQELFQRASEVRKRGGGQKEAERLAADIEERAMDFFSSSKGRPVPVDEANKTKTFIDKQIKEAGFLAGNEASTSKQGQQAFSNQLRGDIPSAVSSVDPKLSERLKAANRTFAATDNNMFKKARQWARTAPEMRGPFDPTAVDLMLLGTGAGVGYMSDGAVGAPIGALGAKFLGRHFLSTAGRTARGKLAQRMATTGGLIDPFARQAPRSVWEAIQGEE